MHRAARTDVHGRSPHPTQRLQDSLDGCFVDARSRVALAALPCACALVGRCAVHEVIYLLIRKTGCYGDGSHNAVAGLASVSASGASAVIELKVSNGMTPYSLPAATEDVVDCF